MRKITLSLFFFLLFASGFAQNLCLEKLPTGPPFTMAVQSDYNTSVCSPADFNNDGKPDIVYATEHVNTSSIPFQSYYMQGIIKGDGTGIYTVDSTWLASPGPKCFVTADFNEDGNADFVAASSAGNVLLHTGDGNYGFSVTPVSAYGNYWSGMVTGDFNSDGHADLVLTGMQMGNVISFVPGNGNGTFGTPVIIFTGSYSLLRKGDFNNDGLPDVTIGDGILFNYGGGNFVDIPMTKPSGFFDVGDFNQDGNLDMIGADTIYLGSGAGTFPVHVGYTLPAGVTNFWRTADMNADGNPDLLTKRGSGDFDTLMVFTGNGNATFTQSNVDIPLDSLYGLAEVGDMDSNGMNDLVMFRAYVDFESPMTDIYTIINYTAHITASSPALCQGDSIQLFANPGTLNYNWSTGDTTSSIYVSSGGTYTLTISAPGGCSSTTTYNVSSVTATSFAPINTSGHFCYYASSFTLNSGSPAGGSYSGPGVTNGIFDPQAAGVGTHTLYYSVTGSGNCTGTDSLQVIVDLCMGTPALAENSGLKVYPNPASDNVTIEWSDANANSSFQLFDALGNCVLREDGLSGKQNTINTSGLAEGIYALRFCAGEKIEVRKIFIVR